MVAATKSSDAWTWNRQRGLSAPGDSWRQVGELDGRLVRGDQGRRDVLPLYLSGDGTRERGHIRTGRERERRSSGAEEEKIYGEKYWFYMSCSGGTCVGV